MWHAERYQAVSSFDAVEKGKDRGSLLGGLSHHGSDRVERIAFDAEDREVSVAELVGAIGGRDLHFCRSLSRSDLEASTADRCEILSAGVERDIVSRARQLPAVIGADRASAEHYDFHGFVSTRRRTASLRAADAPTRRAPRRRSPRT